MIELSKAHILSDSPTSMNISSYAQETMCYMGQHLVFKEAEEVINSLTGAEVNAKQVERICHHYGDSLEQEQLYNIEVKGYQEVLPEESRKCHYVSVDGSMYYTREDGWKEIKLGRIYKHEDLMEVSKDRCELLSSDYVAHLGSSKDFLPKMEYCIENIKNKVFIADGATWIWNWVEDTYPECEQIVDFFHAKEHLCEFAKEYFKDKSYREQWIDKQSEVMLNKGISPVIKSLDKLPEKTEKLRQLIGYYTNHQKRMQYHFFKEKGLVIGSGAIESAHKDVLQKRLKLSGQRWTKKGIQQVAQIRVAYKAINGIKLQNYIKMLLKGKFVVHPSPLTVTHKIKVYHIPCSLKSNTLKSIAEGIKTRHVATSSKFLKKAVLPMPLNMPSYTYVTPQRCMIRTIQKTS